MAEILIYAETILKYSRTAEYFTYVMRIEYKDNEILERRKLQSGVLDAT
jgi:hypothetical protein